METLSLSVESNLVLYLDNINTKRWRAVTNGMLGVPNGTIFSHLLDVHETYCRCRDSQFYKVTVTGDRPINPNTSSENYEVLTGGQCRTSKECTIPEGQSAVDWPKQQGQSRYKTLKESSKDSKPEGLSICNVVTVDQVNYLQAEENQHPYEKVCVYIPNNHIGTVVPLEMKNANPDSQNVSNSAAIKSIPQAENSHVNGEQLESGLVKVVDSQDTATVSPLPVTGLVPQVCQNQTQQALPHSSNYDVTGVPSITSNTTSFVLPTVNPDQRASSPRRLHLAADPNVDVATLETDKRGTNAGQIVQLHVVCQQPEGQAGIGDEECVQKAAEIKREPELQEEIPTDLDDGSQNSAPHKELNVSVLKKDTQSDRSQNLKFVLFPTSFHCGACIANKPVISEQPSNNLMVRGMTRTSALNPPNDSPDTERGLYVLNFLEMYLTAKLLQEQGISVSIAGYPCTEMYSVLKKWLFCFYGITVNSADIKLKSDALFQWYKVFDEKYERLKDKDSFNELCQFLSNRLSGTSFRISRKRTRKKRVKTVQTDSCPQKNMETEDGAQEVCDLDFRVYRVLQDEEQEQELNEEQEEMKGDVKPDVVGEDLLEDGHKVRQTSETEPSKMDSHEKRHESEREPSQADILPFKQEPCYEVSECAFNHPPSDSSLVNGSGQDGANCFQARLLESDQYSDSTCLRDTQFVDSNQTVQLPEHSVLYPHSSQMNQSVQDKPTGSWQMKQSQKAQTGKRGPKKKNLAEKRETSGNTRNMKLCRQDGGQKSSQDAVCIQNGSSVSAQELSDAGRRLLKPRGKRKKFAADFSQLFKSDKKGNESECTVNPPSDSNLINLPPDSNLINPPPDSNMNKHPPSDSNLINCSPDSNVINPPSDSNLMNPPLDSNLFNPHPDSNLVNSPPNSKVINPPSVSNLINPSDSNLVNESGQDGTNSVPARLQESEQSSDSTCLRDIQCCYSNQTVQLPVPSSECSQMNLSVQNEPTGSWQMEKSQKAQTEDSGNKTHTDKCGSKRKKPSDRGDTGASGSKMKLSEQYDIPQSKGEAGQQGDPSSSSQDVSGRRQLKPRGKQRRFAADFSELFRSDTESEEFSSESTSEKQGQSKSKRKRVAKDFSELFESEDEYLPPEKRKEDFDLSKNTVPESSDPPTSRPKANADLTPSCPPSVPPKSRFAKVDENDLKEITDGSLSKATDRNTTWGVKLFRDGHKQTQSAEDSDEESTSDLEEEEEEEEEDSVSEPASTSEGTIFSKGGKIRGYDEDFKRRVVKFAIENNLLHAARKFNLRQHRIKVWMQKDNWGVFPEELAVKEGDETKSKKQKRTAYQANFKLKVIAFAEIASNSRAAKKFKVDERQVRNWRKMKSVLLKMPKTKKCQRHGKTPHVALERKLAAWIKGLRQCGYMVTRNMICQQALELYKKTHQQDEFLASVSWCTRFLTRQQMNTYRKLFVRDTMPPNIKQKVCAFYQTVHEEQLLQVKYELKQIGCMDEIPFAWNIDKGFGNWEEMSGLTTHSEGAVHFTVAVSYLADGTKLKPMVICEKKPEKMHIGVTSGVHPKGLMDEMLVLQWLRDVWLISLSVYKRKSVLVWDQFKPHLSDAVQAKLKESAVVEVQIPLDCTSILHPVESCLKYSFKSTLIKSLNDWNDQCKQSQSSKQSQLYDTFALLVKEVWDQIPQDLVKRSFEQCGLIKVQTLPSKEKMEEIMQMITLCT